MRVFNFLLASFFILSGCEGLPFTNEDTQDTTEQSSPTDNETEGQNELEKQPDTPQIVDENPLPEKIVRINIEEREAAGNSIIIPDDLQAPEEAVLFDDPAKEIKVSITDNSPKDHEEMVTDLDFPENNGKTTEWTISRTETEVQPPVEASPLGDEANLPDETRELTEINPPEESELVAEPVSEPISEEETTIISEDLKLTKDSIIQDRKVVLNRVTIKTFEHDLTIRAEEFISNHSIIQNFWERKEAKKRENAKNGGNILIEAEVAQGELQLILNGEHGRRVSRKSVSRKKLKGQRGKNGQDAVYRKYCRDIRFLGLLTVDRRCRYRCVAPPTGGQDGEDGQKGLPGFDGKDGGNAGSFHLKAFQMSDFRLTDVQNTPGKGSKGGKGSSGGYGGQRGRNGRDYKDLCSYSSFSRTKTGKSGKRGPRGKNGKRGEKGTVCLEKLSQNESSFGTEINGSLICQ